MRRTLYAFLLALPFAGCASHRYLPLPPPDQTPSPVPVSSETTRFLFLKGAGDDAAIDRVFISPVTAGPMLVTVRRPAPGVLSSTDGGASWTFFELPPDLKVMPRILREVIFDPADANRIYARAFNGLLTSADGGKTFKRIQVGDRKNVAIDAFALAPDGTLYVAQHDRIYSSDDHGETLQQLPLVIEPPGAAKIKGAPEDVPPDLIRIRSVLPDPAHPKTVYISIEPEPPVENFQRRVIGLLDHATSEGDLAREILKLPADKPVDRVTFGDLRAGVYVTHDGGRDWHKTGFGLDSWLVALDGSIYAVVAEPLVTAAGLVARSPALAAAIGAQLHENAFDPESLRRACVYPGRNALIAAPPPAPIFRSTDEGATWTRLASIDLTAAFALRLAIDRQALGRDPWPPRPFIRSKAQIDRDHEHQMPPGIGSDDEIKRRNAAERARKRALSEPEPETPPDLTTPLLLLLDPAGMLSNLGPVLPLTGLSTSGGAIWAYAPTPSYWNQLADTLVKTTRKQGELAIGNGTETPAEGNGFELLRSTDGGASWETFPATVDPFGVLSARGVSPYPEAVAATSSQAFYLLSGTDKKLKLWRQLLRESAPAKTP